MKNIFFSLVVLATLGSLFLPQGAFAASNATDLSTLQHIIGAAVVFIGKVLIPLLFSIALLMFMVNAARYYIIEGDNEESRKKAKRLTLYSIAAFVFLVSLWGIINMFVGGFSIGREEVICPDYLSGGCNSRSVQNTNQNSLAPRGYTQKKPTTKPAQISPNKNPGATNPGATTNAGGIEGLIFDNSQNTTSFSFNPGPPQKNRSTVAISPTASCTTAFSTLSAASKVENNEVAYLTYKDSNGITRWRNVTDSNSVNSVTYDGDTIAGLLTNGATNLTLVHTHQKSNTDDLGLNATGNPPSVDDIEIACDDTLGDIRHMIVDWDNVWILGTPTGTCPRTQNQISTLPAVEAILQLSEIVASDRNQVFNDLLQSNTVPAESLKQLQSFKGYDFSTMTSSEIFTLSKNLRDQANLPISNIDITSACASL